MPKRASPPSSATDALVLGDGTRLAVGPVTPASKPLIAEAMTRLSPESIRRRFFAPRRELSDAELNKLTALDGWNEFALGASRSGTDGFPEGVAVARFARIAPDADTAEIAITVVDAMQQRGIGKALLGRLADAARARGIRRLRAIVLPDNAPMIGLLRGFAPRARWRREGGNLVTDFPLPTKPVLARRTSRRRLPSTHR